VLELRWVLARFRPLMPARLVTALCVPATVIALARLTAAPRAIEITAGFALVAIGLGHAAATGRLSRTPAVVAGAALAVGLGASLGHPVLYGIVLAHLHNVVTAALVWHWAGGSRAFRRTLVVAYAAVPALVLAGAVDRLLPATLAAAGPTHLLAASVAPPVALTTTLGIRMLAVFAFLQLVHYGIWCWLLPRRDHARTAPAQSSRAVSSRSVPWTLVIAAATALLAFVFRTDYATGRTLYTSVATYHAYLELPVVLVLLGGARAPR
jgi:hypothetical protein